MRASTYLDEAEGVGVVEDDLLGLHVVCHLALLVHASSLVPGHKHVDSFHDSLATAYLVPALAAALLEITHSL